MARESKGIQSVEIGFEVLGCLEKARRPLALTEIARAAGMSLAKCRFYLVSFLRVGVVSQDSSGGRYRLGPRALRLGLTALAQVDVVESARAEMIRLRERTGDTVFLSVWGDLGATVISRLDGEKVAPLEVRVGAIMPLLSSATGRVFLAYLPAQVTREPLRREAKRLTTAQARRIAEVKARGLASIAGGVLPGIVALSAPVMDADGALRAALTLMGQKGRLDLSYTGASSRALVESARRASAAAGFTGDIWSRT